VVKYGRVRQATDDNKTQRMRFVCWVIRATDIHSEYVTIILLHGNKIDANAPRCYIYMYMASHVLCSLFHCRRHSTNAPYSSSFTCYCHHKDERAKPENLPKKKKKKKKNVLSEIEKYWMKKYFQFFFLRH